MCRFFDAHESTKQCTEEDAEEVRDKSGSNFCEYFDPRPDAFDAARRNESQRAAQQLQSLFGDESPGDGARSPDKDQQQVIDDAEALFRK